MKMPSESRLSAMLKSTAVGFWEWNIDSGELNVDERWAEMLGYELSELQPFSFQRWESLLHPQDKRSNLEKVTAALEKTSDTYDCVVRLRHKDGSWRWIRTRGIVFDDDESGDQWFVGSHTDLTEQQQTQHQLTQIAESLPGIIYTFVMKPDGSQFFSYLSRKTEEFYGIPSEIAIKDAKLMFDVVHPEDLPRIMDAITESYETLCEFSCDYRVEVGGITYWMRGMSLPERDSDGTVTWHGMVFNIDNQKKLENDLKQLSITDELTGAFNRRYMLKELEIQLQGYQRYGHSFSLISIDIDNFKQVNDTQGHQMGDQVLRKLAGIVSDRARKTDVFARTGGEEFLMLMPNTGLAAAKIVAEDLRSAVAAHEFEAESGQTLDSIQTTQVTISAGVVGFAESGLTTVSELLFACDQALYQAKRQGRNCAVAHSPVRKPKPKR